MKKVLAICLMMLMVVSLSVTAFAAPNGFVSSPSTQQAPEVVSFKASDPNCNAVIIITPYSKRDTLPDDVKSLNESAYGDIVSSGDLTKFCNDFKKVVTDKKLDSSKLAVTYLFDVRADGCTTHESHKTFEIELSADALKNFVGLLHKKSNGEWELIDNAEVLSDGKTLRFTVDSFSPFSIVVDTSGTTSPQTGDNADMYLYVVVMSAAALSILTAFAAKKKAL